jgi:hypothetical protein
LKLLGPLPLCRQKRSVFTGNPNSASTSDMVSRRLWIFSVSTVYASRDYAEVRVMHTLPTTRVDFKRLSRVVLCV